QPSKLVTWVRFPSPAPTHRTTKGGRMDGRPSLTRQLSTFWILPNRPCCSPSIPAAKNNELKSPLVLPNRRPHRPSIWIGALVSLFSCPRNLPSGVYALMRPSPKFPTRMSLWKLPKADGPRASTHAEFIVSPVATPRHR